MTLITSADYPDVRRALDASLDATTLPDAAIASPVYQGQAELDVLARYPDAAAATGTAALQVKIATILLTAAYMAPAVPLIVREQDKDYSYQRQAIDWLDAQERLRARAEQVLSGLAGETVTSGDFAGVLFARASGCRGVL